MTPPALGWRGRSVLHASRVGNSRARLRGVVEHRLIVGHTDGLTAGGIRLRITSTTVGPSSCRWVEPNLHLPVVSATIILQLLLLVGLTSRNEGVLRKKALQFL